MSSPSYVRIAGTGSYLPGKPVSNHDLVARGIDTSDEWIVERTGISYRHYAAEGETSSDMALRAGESALTMAGLSAEQLDLIIVATSTPDFIFPSTACLLQKKLDNKGAAAFDMQAVCAGFVYSLAVADSMLRSGQYRSALVVGSEVFSRIMDWQDRSTCVLFGDGAGAVVLQVGDAPGIYASSLHADGAYSDILCVPGQINAGQVLGDPFLRMDGPAVFKIAVRVLSDSIREASERASLSVDNIDWLIPHQANLRIMNAVGRRLGLGAERLIACVGQHANTSAASIPLALDHAVREGKVQRGQNLALAGVGGGFAWGSAVLKF